MHGYFDVLVSASADSVCSICTKLMTYVVPAGATILLDEVAIEAWAPSTAPLSSAEPVGAGKPVTWQHDNICSVSGS